ncbi:MAG: hypothetical protein Q9177_005687 [Variospora cf. flavescens]
MSFSNADTGSKPADPYKEENKNDPELKEKVGDLVKFVESCKFGMMTTRIESSGLLEGGGLDLLFHTNTESGKTDDLKSDPKINMAFLDGQGQWASISGTADIVTDREMVRKYYSPTLKAWLGDLGDGKHDGGPEDPRIGVIKITAQTATYAISEGSLVSRGYQVAKGTVTGQAANVNKLREITEEELQQSDPTSPAQLAYSSPQSPQPGTPRPKSHKPIQLAHVAKERIQHLDEEMDGFQVRELVVVGVDAHAEEEPRVPPVHDLQVPELDEVGLVLLVPRRDEAVDLVCLVLVGLVWFGWGW